MEVRLIFLLIMRRSCPLRMGNRFVHSKWQVMMDYFIRHKMCIRDRVKSDDDGKTWSEPMNITEQVKDPSWYFLLQGPGRGISMDCLLYTSRCV